MPYKKPLSYIFPQKIFSKKSKVSGELKVVISDGKLVLNTSNANYSFGSLQRILEKGLKRIGKPAIKDMSSVLLLGVAGGSVIQSLYEKYEFAGRLKGIEIDEKIISLANRYFGLSDYQQVKIVMDDAQHFVQQTVLTFDLIIVDIFQDVQMPDFLFQEEFVSRLKQLLNIEGYILFNTMVTEDSHKIRNQEYLSKFPLAIFDITRLPMLERDNEVILIKKK